MDDILTELYYLFTPQLQTKEELAILERNEAKIACIERQVSEEDISSFMDVQTELSMYRAEAAFSLGFRLATQILIAAHPSISKNIYAEHNTAHQSPQEVGTASNILK